MKGYVRVLPVKETKVTITLETTLEECQAMLENIKTDHWPLLGFKDILHKALEQVYIDINETKII